MANGDAPIKAGSMLQNCYAVNGAAQNPLSSSKIGFGNNIERNNWF